MLYYDAVTIGLRILQSEGQTLRQVTIVANDIGGRNGLRLLGEFLEKQGIAVCWYLGSGDAISTSFGLTERIANSDAVICGMSSSEKLAAPEIMAANMAQQLGVPFCLFADSFNAHLKPYFNKWLYKAAALMVLNSAEAQKAREHLKDVKVVATGNPAWEKFFFPRFTREEVRDRLTIPEDCFVILSPGTKELVVNVLLWGGLLDAATPLDNALVLASVHPDDQSPIEEYDKLADWSNGRLQVVVSDRDDPESMTGSNMLPGADAVVDCCSTIAIEAACQRIPVITYAPEAAQIRRKKNGGSRAWEPAEMGITQFRDGLKAVYNLACDLRSIAVREFNLVKRKQEEFFPLYPKPGETVKKMAAVIADIIGSREA